MYGEDKMNWKGRYAETPLKVGDKVMFKDGPIRCKYCDTSCKNCTAWKHIKIGYVGGVNCKGYNKRTVHLFQDINYDNIKEHCYVHPDDLIKVD